MDRGNLIFNKFNCLINWYCSKRQYQFRIVTLQEQKRWTIKIFIDG